MGLGLRSQLILTELCFKQLTIYKVLLILDLVEGLNLDVLKGRCYWSTIISLFHGSSHIFGGESSAADEAVIDAHFTRTEVIIHCQVKYLF